MDWRSILLAIAAACSAALVVHAAPPCDTISQYGLAYGNCTAELYASNGNQTSFTDAVHNMCGTNMNNYITCIENKFGSCATTTKDLVVRKANEHKNRMCSGGSLKPEITSALDTMARLFSFGPNATGVCYYSPQNIQLNTEMSYCYANAQMQSFGSGFSNKSIDEALPKLGNFYRATIICMKRVLRAHSTCTDDEIVALLTYYMIILPWADIREHDLKLQSITKPREGIRYTLAAFGDPHIAVFKDSKIRTCGAPGRQVYVENELISIAANNTLARAGSEATVITRLDVSLMDKNGKIQAKYSAGNSLLPSSFENGKDRITIDGQVAEVKSVGRLLRIKAPSAGLVIIVSKYNHMYPTLLIRGSESVFEVSSGLLVDGCVEIPRTVARRKRRDTGCSAACSAAEETKREMCMFDCDILEDTEFVKRTNEDLKEGEKEAESVDYEMADDHNSAHIPKLTLLCFLGITFSTIMY